MLCTFFIGVMLGGCGSETGHGSVADALEMRDGSAVVAVVDDVEITTREFQEFWTHHPELERKEVVDALVARAHAQVLMQSEPAALESAVLRTARKRGLVNAMLADEVEKITRTADETLIEEERTRMSNPAGFRVSHLVVTFPPTASAEMIASAKKVAQDLIDALPEDATLTDLAGRMPKAEPPMRVLVAPHMRFPAPGAVGYLPEGWAAVDPSFAGAVAAMADKRETFSRAPVRSSQAWHVVFLEETIPGHVASDDEVETAATRRATAEARYRKLQKMLEEELPRTDLALFPEVLNEKEGQ